MAGGPSSKKTRSGPVSGGPSSKKTRSGPVAGGPPRSTETGTGTAPGVLTCGLVKQSHQFLRFTVVYKLGSLLGSVGHRVKIHNITSETGKERGDLEIKDYVVMQKPQPQTNRLPPPHTQIMYYTMTHTRFGRSHVYP